MSDVKLNRALMKAQSARMRVIDLEGDDVEDTILIGVEFDHPKTGDVTKRVFYLTTEDGENLAAALLDAVIKQRRPKA